MDIVGLPDAAVQESRQRVQTATKNAMLPYPHKRLVVNLSPATVRKEGPAYDLPIALGVLITAEVLPPECAEGTLVVGELSLDGTITPIVTWSEPQRWTEYDIISGWSFAIPR